SDSKSAHSTGLKTRLRVVRGSGDPAVEHRIGPDDYPVNILGGHRWPDAPKLGSTIETVLWKEGGELTSVTAYDLPEAARPTIPNFAGLRGSYRAASPPSQ